MNLRAGKRAIGEFWESRTGGSRLKQLLLLEPIVGGSCWAAVFGSMLLFAFALQVITGVLLATNYSPSADSAWASVSFIETQVPSGSFLRAVHHWGASVMIVLLAVHVLQVFLWGAYKRPRELTWLGGVLQLFCVLGLAFTGYLLRWDQNAYWATQVGLGIAGTAPLAGDGLRTLMAGGPQIGNLTLTRFFALHGFVLPGLLAMLVVVHVYLFRLHGLTPHWARSPEQLAAKREPFWPGQAWKDLVAAFLLLVAIGVCSYYLPAPLGEAADASRPYDARPEWYFMFLFQLLKFFEGPLEVVGTFVLPTLFILALALWPFLDRTIARSPSRRPLAISLLALCLCGLLGLEVYAITTDVRSVEQVPVVAGPVAAVSAPPVGPARIAGLYRERCSLCHGDDGAGNALRAGMPTIPDFTSLPWQISQSDEVIVAQIQLGKPPLMPGFQDSLQQSEIAGLAIFVRAMAIPPVVPKPAPQVAIPTIVPAVVTPAVPTMAPVPPVVSQGSPPAMPPLATPAAAPAKVEPSAPPATGVSGPAEAPAQKTSQVALGESDQPVAKPAPPSDPAAAGKAADVYKETCLVCHGADGRGTAMRPAMPTIPDFSDAKWQKSRTDAELRKSIVEGKGKLMLPMREKLGALDPQRLVEYVRKLAKTPPAAKAVAKTEPAPPKKSLAAPPIPSGSPKVSSAGSPAEATPVPATPVPATPAAAPSLSANPPPKADPPGKSLPIKAKVVRNEVGAKIFGLDCATCHGANGKGTPMRTAAPTIPDFTAAGWQEKRSAAQLTASIRYGKGGLMPAFQGDYNPEQVRALVSYVQSFAPASTKPEPPAEDDLEQRFGDLRREFSELEKQIQQLSAKSRAL